MSDTKTFTPRILHHFSICNDPRTRPVQHKLSDIITIVILGTLCGEEGWDGFFDWALDKEEYLRKFLSLEHGIPGPDTMRRVISRLDPEAFLQAFVSWANEVSSRLPGQICIDGKVLASALENGSPLQMVSAWCEATQMVLGSIKAGPKKRGEIPAIEELLDKLILGEGDVVTIDAIGCQQKITQKVREKKADYLIAVKQNQPTLWSEIDNFFTQALEAPEYAPCVRHEYETKEHGRHDQLEIWVTHDIEWLETVPLWEGLKSLIMVRRKREESTETRYYISSLQGSPEKLGELIRRHWSIENEFHWHLDVTFGEDSSRIEARANANLRVARNVALALLRAETTFKRGLKSKMRKCHRSEEYLNQVLMVGNF